MSRRRHYSRAKFGATNGPIRYGLTVVISRDVHKHQEAILSFLPLSVQLPSDCINVNWRESVYLSTVFSRLLATRPYFCLNEKTTSKRLTLPRSRDTPRYHSASLIRCRVPLPIIAQLGQVARWRNHQPWETPKRSLLASQVDCYAYRPDTVSVL